MPLLPLPEGASPFPQNGIGSIFSGLGNVAQGGGDLFSGLADVKKARAQAQQKQQLNSYLQNYMKLRRAVGAPGGTDQAGVGNLLGAGGNAPAAPSTAGAGSPPPSPGTPAPAGFNGTDFFSGFMQQNPSLDKIKMLRGYFGDAAVNSWLNPKQPKPGQSTITAYQDPKSGRISLAPQKGMVPFQGSEMQIRTRLGQQGTQDRTFNAVEGMRDYTKDKNFKQSSNAITQKYDPQITQFNDAINALNASLSGGKVDSSKVIAALQNLQGRGNQAVSKDAISGLDTHWWERFSSAGKDKIVALRNALVDRKHSLEKAQNAELKELSDSFSVTNRLKANMLATTLQQAGMPPDEIEQHLNDYQSDLGEGGDGQ